MSRCQRLLFSLTVLVVVVLAPSAPARPPYKKALADFIGPGLSVKLNDCTACHLPDPPGKDPLDKDKPHNAFGARLKAVRQELRKAGKPTSIAARLDAVLEEDSDGDGVSNLLELLTGHFPGDARDRPGAAELAEAKKLVAAFVQAKQMNCELWLSQ